MSSYVLELLDESHDRAGFFSGLESVDRYLRETARGHLEKGVSVTRVLVKTDASLPKIVLGYYTLSSITVEAREWSNAPKRLANPATWFDYALTQMSSPAARLETLQRLGKANRLVNAENIPDVQLQQWGITRQQMEQAQASGP